MYYNLNITPSILLISLISNCCDLHNAEAELLLEQEQTWFGRNPTLAPFHIFQLLFIERVLTQIIESCDQLMDFIKNTF